MSEAAAFKGFTKQTVKFFKDLAGHNNRTWFEAHRDIYESEVMAPARAFIEAMGARLRPEIPKIVAVPKVNKSIFKINRDTRFTLDPAPRRCGWPDVPGARQSVRPALAPAPPVTRRSGGLYYHSGPGRA